MIFSGNNFSFELGKKTYVMGILNVTKDSFADGGKYNTPEKAKEHTREMLLQGADIIDIGAQSTRPGSVLMSVQEELNIIKQYLPCLANEFDCVFSVDTFYPEVAEYALNNGASIINDVSGKFNKDMAELVLKYDCGWIITHTGNGDAQTVPDYKTSVTEDVITFFDEVLDKCNQLQIPHNRIMLDIGIGFGKSYEHNIEVIKNIKRIKRQNVALLTALSLKRVVGIATDSDREDRLYGTISANTLAIVGGTDFIRVHNVKESVLGAKMADAVLRG
ncbi:MAG: dihydropteroate synthase [Clostridia bacterium]|nr:dihydropteroate synthase [Clostridia bacterium]